MRATLLALETSTNHAAIAVIQDGDEGPRVLGLTPDPSFRHGRILVPSIRSLLESAGLSARDLDGLAVGLGPGSYTGLRIGLMAAKSLAYALGKPLAGLDSLEVAAQNAPDDALRVSVIGDAQRGDLYVANFGRHTAGAPLARTTETRILNASRWAESLLTGTFVLGPALEAKSPPAVPEHARRPDRPDRNRPDPQALGKLAARAWESGRREDVFFVEPIYLRRSAAEDQWDGLSAKDSAVSRTD